MTKRGKKYAKARAHISIENFSLKDALSKVKEVGYAKFDESVDVGVNLGIDPSKGEQVVRGSVILPHGRGKVPRVIVFAKGDHAEQAQRAGADAIGADDLIEKISGGWLDFDYAVATPDMVGVVAAKLAKILGPQGKLPNKKLGTVTFDVGSVVAELKGGRAFFKNDKQGIVHFSFGKKSFDVARLHENFIAFLKALNDAKPATAKGKYIKRIHISSTMGPSVAVGLEDLS